jgi:cbb3-type cytochrome oxidase subunit 3
MFHVVSNPFAEMAQGVAESGIGYIAEKSSKSDNFGWLWWLLIPIVLVIMGLVYIAYQDKKKKELEEARKRKLEEEEKKLGEKQKEITS